MWVLGNYEKESDYYSYIRDLITQHNLEQFVHFPGFAREPFGLVRNAIALIHPSRSEGWGRAVAEAMLIGTPVVSTRSGGLAELVIPGKTGLSFEPGEIVELGELLQKIITDRLYADRLSKSAESHVTQMLRDNGGEIKIKEYIDKIISLGSKPNAGIDYSTSVVPPTWRYKIWRFSRKLSRKLSHLLS